LVSAGERQDQRHGMMNKVHRDRESME